MNWIDKTIIIPEMLFGYILLIGFVLFFLYQTCKSAEYYVGKIFFTGVIFFGGALGATVYLMIFSKMVYTPNELPTDIMMIIFLITIGMFIFTNGFLKVANLFVDFRMKASS